MSVSKLLSPRASALSPWYGTRAWIRTRNPLGVNEARCCCATRAWSDDMDLNHDRLCIRQVLSTGLSYRP
jgi:hypothetical protein